MCPKCGKPLVDPGGRKMCPTCGWAKVPDINPPRPVENRGVFRKEPDDPPGVVEMRKNISAWFGE
jgi:uncharacterized Zn finger protein (UPF0148 family)